MDRRKFLKMLGIGGGATLVAPLLPEAPKVEEVTPAQASDNYYGGGSVFYMPTGGYIQGSCWMPTIHRGEYVISHEQARLFGIPDED